MKHIFLFVIAMIAVVLAVAMTGCAEYKVGRELRRFARQGVEFPETMESVHRRNIVSEGLPDGNGALVVYYDSTECSGCRINRLMDLMPVYELSDSLGTFDVLTVFSPRQDEYDEVCLLLNREGRPVFVGNPVASDRLGELFMTALEKLEK